MAFDWESYLTLAKELGKRADEASQRSALSRAYYSAFHAADACLKRNNIRTNPKDQRNPHLRVWKAYTESQKKPCRRIGADGLKLKLGRVHADYESNSQIDATFVTHSLLLAERLLQDLRTNLPEGYGGPLTPVEKMQQSIRRLFSL